MFATNLNIFFTFTLYFYLSECNIKTKFSIIKRKNHEKEVFQ